MDLMRWSPLRDLDELFARHGRTIDSSLPSLLGADVKWRPAANIVENDTEFTIRADLPEVKKEDIDVTVDGGVLTISGERRIEKSTDNEKEHRRETFHGQFSRSFTLPEGTDESGISAETKDGVLIVHVPKVVVEKRQPVSIKIG
jgi:HSP20 family protein